MSDLEDKLSPEEEAALKADVQPPAPNQDPEPEPAPAPAPPPAPEPPKAEAPKPEPKEEPRGGPNNAIAEMRRELAELRRREAAREAAQKPQEPQIPALEADPAGNLHARQSQTEEQVRAMLAAQQQQAQLGQVMTAYATAAQEFAAQNKDFNDAYQHLLSGRAAELQAIGLTGAELAHALKTDELAIVSRALRDGVNPAERLYNVAKARGWAPKAPEAPKPASPAPSMVEEIAKGQQLAANPLANAGAAPIPELTAATLAAMSDDEVAALPEAKWRKAMGG